VLLKLGRTAGVFFGKWAQACPQSPPVALHFLIPNIRAPSAMPGTADSPGTTPVATVADFRPVLQATRICDCEP
jgi:hypothetical protein